MKQKDERFIYVIGHVGNEGTKCLIDYKKNELISYFNNKFIGDIYDKIIDEEKYLFSIVGKNIIKSLSTCHFNIISKGGIYSSLWDLSKKEFVGMDFSQRDIPVFQETIEICNFYDILPYRLYSKNCYLIFENKGWLYNIQKKYGNLPIKCIGKLYNKKECARIDGDAKSYLTKDYKDEIDKIIPVYTKKLNNCCKYCF